MSIGSRCLAVRRRVFSRRVLTRRVLTRLTTLTTLVTCALAAVGIGLSRPAQAEGQIRIAEQFGVVYLLLNIAHDQQLIEKEGRKQGLDIHVDWTRLSGGAEINNALLAGAIDIGGAGTGPLFTIWDRTRGKQNVKGVASLGDLPYYLVSTDPNVKTIADFTDKDRIAVPATTVSVQSRILQMAAAKAWGDANYQRLDKYTVTLAHPDATAAIIAGKTEINSHFGNPPFQEQELAGNPHAHIVLNSNDVFGGPSSATVLYATQKFHDENPKTYRAFVAALVDAAQFATSNPEAAADIYIRVNKSNIDRAILLKVLKNPEVHFQVTPHRTFELAEFMARVGAIQNRPSSWQDYFFADPAIGNGS